LQRWAGCESKIHRKYFWYSKEELVQNISKDPRAKESSLTSKSKAHVLNELVEAEKKHDGILSKQRIILTSF